MNAPEAETGVPAPRGRWEFNEAVAAKFDEHVRASVPDYEAIQLTAAALAEFYAPDGGTVHDYGCSTGQTLGLIAGTAEKAGKRLRLTGWDASEPMIAKAKATRAPGIGFNVGRIPEVLDTNHAAGLRMNFGCFLYTLQFLTAENRARALRAAYETLEDGGALFVVEKVFGGSPWAHDLTSQLYAEMKLNNGLTAEQVIAKTRSLRGVMHPLTVAENERAFERAGFDRHELIYRRLSFAGWIVQK